MSLVDLIPSRATLQLLAGSVLGLLALNGFLTYRRVLKSVGHHPGIRHPISGVHLLGFLLPPIPGLSLGPNWSMEYKYKIYAQYGWDTITWAGIFPKIDIAYFVADPLTVKEITSNRARFPKDVKDYTVLAFFGSNILVTEGEVWKKQRKLAAPTFSERNNGLVWSETVRIIQEMFASWGPDNSDVVVDHCLDITLPITLLTISSAGFGRRIPWVDDKAASPGHQLSFKDAVHIVSKHLQVAIVVPRWAYRFSKFLKSVGLALDELNAYLREMVEERRASEVRERYDLFSALLEGNDSSKEDGKLTEDEIIGLELHRNIFIFLIAGHETTAHTLCFLLGLLAIEQEEQDKLYESIVTVLPNGEIPTYEQFGALSYVMATFNETLRLFPPVANIPKYSVDDTTLPAVQPDGSIGSVPVPKGTKMIISSPALHCNPRYWKDPYAFNPSRFLGDWPRDAFLPFSGGARACIGRGFAETESVAAITMIIQKYKVELKNPELYAGLTPLEKREKLLANRQGLTTTPINVPLIFRKRS
ncbi:cytochrome P450 [Hysterangium stoloniferum]|nr:cytochrome P450 [Hysterangium stoloniferum]